MTFLYVIAWTADNGEQHALNALNVLKLRNPVLLRLNRRDQILLMIFFIIIPNCRCNMILS